MNKFYLFFKTHLQELAEFRGDIAIYTFSGAVLPLVSLAIWLSLGGGTNSLKLSRDELAVYFLLASLIKVLTSAWGGFFIASRINRGDITQYLLKPYSLYGDFLAQNLAEKTYKVLFISIVILLAWVYLLNNMKVDEFSTLSIILFIPSLIMAILISFTIDTVTGLLGFWFQDIEFIRGYLGIIINLFSGLLIPLTLMPTYLQQVALVLPFRFYISFPIEVLTNKISGMELFIGFAYQAFWLLTFILIYNLMYRKGIKAYQAFGA